MVMTTTRWRGKKTVWYLLLLLLVLALKHTTAETDANCSSTAVTMLPRADGLCDCQEGWGGPQCDLCMRDSVCQTSSDMMICRRDTVIAIDNMNGWCRTAGKAVDDLLNGAGGAYLLKQDPYVVLQRTLTICVYPYYTTGWVSFAIMTNQRLAFSVWKQRKEATGEDKFIRFFTCHSSKTKQIVDPKRKEVVSRE